MASTSNLSQILAALKPKVNIQASESLRFTDDVLSGMLVDAIRAHNSRYIVTDNGSSPTTVVAVPNAEVRPCYLLAWADLMDERASGFAIVGDVKMSPPGYGVDRNSPYYKCTDYAKKLREMYNDLCKSLGLEEYAGADKIIEGSVVKEEYATGRITNIADAPENPPIELQLMQTQVQSDGSLTLQLIFKKFSWFVCAKIYYTDNGVTPYNAYLQAEDSKNGPRIVDDAELIYTLGDQNNPYITLRGLSIAPAKQHKFIAVLEARTGKRSYSNGVGILQS